MYKVVNSKNLSHSDLILNRLTSRISNSYNGDKPIISFTLNGGLVMRWCKNELSIRYWQEQLSCRQCILS